jgi:predicted nucleotide-binding protein
MEDKPESKSGEGKRKYATMAFPKNTLKEALCLAQSIQDNNAGQPYNRLDLATSLGWSPESSGFRTLITSSSRYGLTQGSYAAEKISLTNLGKSIVAPRTDEEKGEGLLKALKTIDLFRNFFERFDQSKLPRDDLIKNTLQRDFGIPKEDVDSCLNILKRNLTDWGLLVDYKENTWLRLDKLSVEKVIEEKAPSLEKEEEEQPPPEEGMPQPETLVPNVFISHSKNETILEQIKTILEFGQFKHTIAEEVETTSIPIPDKIFGLMRKCNCAIINISADEKEKNPDGTYRVNPNVLIEIGGAFLAYNKRVILLTDKRVSLPSNLQGLYRCEYEGNELSFSAALKLQKALAQFRELNF